GHVAARLPWSLLPCIPVRRQPLLRDRKVALRTPLRALFQKPPEPDPAVLPRDVHAFTHGGETLPLPWRHHTHSTVRPAAIPSPAPPRARDTSSPPCGRASISRRASPPPRASAARASRG